MIMSRTSVTNVPGICSRGRPLKPSRVFVVHRSFALMVMGLVGCTGPTGSTVRVSPPSITTQPVNQTVTATVSAAAVAPTITTQPANQTVTAGQTATFTVVATGTAPLSYQWQKNG